MNKHTVSAITVAALMSAGMVFAAGENNVTTKAEDMSAKHAQHSGKPMGKKMMAHAGMLPGFDQLNLTDAQKAQIKQIVEANRPVKPENHEQQRTQFVQKMQQRQAQEQQLLMSKNFDERAARQLIEERQQERAQMMRDHEERELQQLKTRHAVFQVLTPAQQKQFLANQQQHQQRMMKMRHRPHGQFQPTEK